MASGRRGIWMIWGWANGCGVLLGVALHLAFAHPAVAAAGTNHLLAQKLTFSTVAFVLCLLQQMLVRVFVRTTWRDILFHTGLTVSAFWIGFYAVQISTPHLLAILAAALTGGWLSRNRCGEWRRWMWLSTVGFLAAAVLEILASRSLHLEISGTVWLINHVMAFNYFGLFAGVASAVMTAGQLANSLRRKSLHPFTTKLPSLQLLLQ